MKTAICCEECMLNGMCIFQEDDCVEDCDEYEK